ncbi:MAG: P-II family nitrogen regulator, partial [Aquiluna sp.]
MKQRKLVTVVIEAGLARRLEGDLRAAGAKGFTSTLAHGSGPRDQRAS